MVTTIGKSQISENAISYHHLDDALKNKLNLIDELQRQIETLREDIKRLEKNVGNIDGADFKKIYLDSINS